MKHKKLFTLTQAAKKIGCNKSTTSRQAKALGLGIKPGHDVLLTEAEVKKLAKAIQPRPRK